LSRKYQNIIDRKGQTDHKFRTVKLSKKFKNLLEEIMGFNKSAVLSVAAALTLTSGAAFAGSHESYPSKPVKILVGFSAGGGTDTTSRGFASYMHEAESMAGQPAYIVNLPGASGQKAAKMVLGEKADGHTLYMINIGTFIVGELAKGKDKPYSVKDDWVNLGCMSQLVTSLQVHTSNPAKNIAEFVAAAKASGKTHTWGTSGATTMHSGIGHLFFDTYGIPHKKVPFKGGSKARAALVSQSVESVFGGNNTIAGFEDTIRPLATAGADRDPTMKDLATFKEQGMDGADFTGLFCLFAPKGVSDEVKTKVGSAIKHIAGIKGFKRFMKKNNLGAFYVDADAAVKAQNVMYKTMGPVVEKILSSQ
jgi:tripartite-type tricarboxylate transporter receptor subunit TctC